MIKLYGIVFTLSKHSKLYKNWHTESNVNQYIFSCLISINQFILLHKIFSKVRTYIRNWKLQAHQFLIFWYISLKSLQFLISEFLLISGSLLYCLLDHYCSAGTGIDSKPNICHFHPSKSSKPNPIGNLIHFKIFKSFIFGRLFHYLNGFHVCLRFVTDDACTNQIDS